MSIEDFGFRVVVSTPSSYNSKPEFLLRDNERALYVSTACRKRAGVVRLTRPLAAGGTDFLNPQSEI